MQAKKVNYNFFKARKKIIVTKTIFTFFCIFMASDFKEFWMCDNVLFMKPVLSFKTKLILLSLRKSMSTELIIRISMNDLEISGVERKG